MQSFFAMEHHILFIGDTTIQTEMIRTELQRFGLNIEIINQPEAIDTLKQRPPGAIVIDTCDNTNTIYSLCQQLSIQQELAHIPIILLVCADEMEIAPLAVHIGAYDYIARDMFVVRNLVEVLRQLHLV